MPTQTHENTRMERIEVTALLSPSRRRSQLRAQHERAHPATPKREEITIEPLEEEAFLRSLEEKLQQHIDRLDQVDLLLGAKQINCLAFRLHEALEPKRDPQTNVIQAWTIQPQAQMKVKMSSHIQVLKLSTILREVRRLRINQQSLLRSPIEVDVFPSLRSIEIVHTEAAALRNVHFFARQLRVLRLEHSALESLAQVLSPQTSSLSPVSWTRLESLRVNCCSLASVDECFNRLEVVKVVDLGWNEITKFEAPAECSSIQWLDLCHNKLSSFPPLSKLSALKILNLSMNHIQSLDGVDALSALVDLDVSSNALAHIGEVELLSQLSELRRLVIRENPIARRPDYRREVLFYLGERVEVDDEAWTTVELQTMKISRRLQTRTENPAAMAILWDTVPLAVGSTWSQTSSTMGYPALSRVASILAQPVEISPPPRLYSPRRRKPQPTKSSSSLKATAPNDRNGARSSVEGTTTEVTDDFDEDLQRNEPLILTVDDFFRTQRVLEPNASGKASILTEGHVDVDVGDGIRLESDSDDDSSSEKGRNRSRKYTESDFMRDFEEEETLLQDGAVEPVQGRTRRSSSAAKVAAKNHQGKSENGANLRVLLSAEDAAVFDLAYGIDGLAAAVEVKANEILETLHVPERESKISFSRRLADVVGVGTSTHSTKAKIVALKLRKSDRSFGAVTYQIDASGTFARLLSPLLGHLYTSVPEHPLPTTCVCSNCGGVSHLTAEYTGMTRGATADAIVLHACLLCTSLNVREVSCERMLAIYASEGMTHLAKRIKPASERHAQSEVGFSLEEQEIDTKESRVCVFISSNGFREVVDTVVKSADAMETEVLKMLA